MTENNTTPPRRIIYVHGYSLKPSEPVLEEFTRHAIRSGIQRDYPEDIAAFDEAEVGLAYYGDVTRPMLSDRGRDYDEELDIGDRKNALIALQSVTRRKKFGYRQYDSLPGKSAKKEFLAGIIAPVMGLFGQTMRLLGRVAPVFAAYLQDEDGLGSRIRERVRGEIIEAMESGATLMIVSHGMGSIVAFDVLWQLSRDPRFSEYATTKIDCFVTMGAPLADNHIRKYLLGANSQGIERYPGNIINWLNLSAEDDYLCHDGTAADDFREMMQEHIVSRITDFRIYNQTVRYGKSNPHSSVGYLIHPRLSKIIRDWLCERPGFIQ